MIDSKWIIRGLAAGLLAGLLSACETPAKSPSFPELSWSHKTPLRFSAGKLVIVDEYLAPLKSPNVEHEFPLVPEDAIRRWATDRIKTGAGDRSVRVIIRNAAVTEHALKVRKGIKDVFYKDQAVRYQGELSVAVEVRDARGFRSSHAEVKVSRLRTVPEEVPPYQLDKIFFKFTSALMTSLDKALEAQIRKHMAKDLY